MFNAAISPAEAVATASAMATPTQARNRAAPGSPAPSACATRVNSATPRLNGAMKTRDAKFSAIWWAATCTVPNPATSKAIRLNALVSAK